MSRAPAKPAGKSRPQETLIDALPTPSPGYLNRSEAPLHSLVFVLPLIVFYEVGTRLFAVDPVTHGEDRIIAFNLLSRFFSLLGATGKYLPAFTVVVVLLAWHVARNDKWTIRFSTLVGMAAESVVWALPLVVVGRVFIIFWQTHVSLLALVGGLKALVVLPIGAGVYEELVFRLIFFTAMNLLLVDVLAIPKIRAGLLMVGISSVAFSLYHYLGNEHFTPESFVFRTAAGVFFGVIFLTRGFGITAGSHAAYDIIVGLLRSLA